MPEPIVPGDKAAQTPDPTVVDLEDGQIEDKKTYTQEDFEKAIQKRVKKIAREKEDLATKYKDYDAIKKDSDEYQKIKLSQQTEVERLANEKNAAENAKIEAETKYAVLQTDLLKQTLCAKSILPADWWEDVKGTTEDEIKASISGLIKKLKLDKQRVGGPTPAGGAPIPKANENVNSALFSYVGRNR